MRNRLLFVLSAVGLLLGVAGAWYFGLRHPPQPPAFSPAADPYARGIFANGIVESEQASGANVNIYPEVSGPIVKVYVGEGNPVRAGAPLFEIDASVQLAVAAQQKAQAEAARALLEELRNQPRPEALEVVRAQMDAAAADVRQVQDQFAKLRESARIEPKSVSRDALDTAENAFRIAQANYDVARRQYELTRAGAWIYDVRNQEKTVASLERQADASRALLQKFTVRAPVDGVVIAFAGTVGAYVSPQGTYDSYLQSTTPVAVMSSGQRYLAVRAYVDEILVGRLPEREHLVAQMQVRGGNVKIPLEFVRIQPYVTPKIELSDQRAERVDLRVLPVVFRFAKPAGINVYPGQLVDVYIGSK